MPGDGQDGGDSPIAATRIRWRVVGLATLMSLLLYLDRFCISISYDYIRQDFGVDKALISLLSSAFFFSYALGQVPAGWLTDRLGGRLMLSIYILAWSAFTGLQGFAQSFWLLCFLQLCCGLAQAGAYPAGARLVRNWMPPADRGVGSSLVAFGGRIGGALAPILTAWMMVQFVPVSVSSEISERTFLNRTVLAEKLSDLEAARRSPQLAHLQRLITLQEQVELATLSQSADREQSRLLREILNRLLRRPDLYRQDLFYDVLGNEGRRLADRLVSGRPLSSEERLRLNRLSLEVAFPQELGNIYVYGWRPSMFVYGAIGILVAAWFWHAVRDDPAHDLRCNAAERTLILRGVESAATAPKETFPWRAFLTDISLWGNCLLQLTTNVGWLFLVRKMPDYLSEVHQVPLITRGWMTSVPIWVGVVAVICGGRLTDALVRRIGLKWGRLLPILLTRFTAALGYGICIALNLLIAPEHAPRGIAWAYVAALSLVAFSTDLGIPAIWGYMQDIGGKYTASLLGWGNMWGNFGAVVATPFYAAILGPHAGPTQWNLLFACLGGVYLLGAVGTLLMDPTRPVTLVVSTDASRNRLK